MPELLIAPTAETCPLELPGEWLPVVIDVLRATSTLVTALSEGVTCVVPVSDVETARTQCAERKGAWLLAGERSGLPPEGFDLGNSPRDFVRRAHAGRSLVFTTTNGTRALVAASRHGPVWSAAFLNLSTVLAELSTRPQNILIVCSGNEGTSAPEDTALAGALAAGLTQTHDSSPPSAVEAMRLYGRWEGDLERNLMETPHGRRLRSKGLEADVQFCARQDRYQVVPVFEDGLITARAQVS